MQDAAASHSGAQGKEGGRGQFVIIHFCPGSLLREERSMACTTGSSSVRSVLLSGEFGLQGPLEGQLQPEYTQVGEVCTELHSV